MEEQEKKGLRRSQRDYGLAFNLQQAEVMIKQAILAYNNKRPHLALNYRTPDEVHKQIALANIH